MIMTDGVPTDKDLRSKVMSTVDYYKRKRHTVDTIDIVAVGIGKQYDPNVLDEMCTKNWVLELYKGRPDLLEKKVDPATIRKQFCHISIEDNSNDMIQFFTMFSGAVSLSASGL